jgi:hypothetical protein
MTLDLYSHVSLELDKRAAAKLNDALRQQRKTPSVAEGD